MISFELWIPFKRVERKGNIKAQNVQLTFERKNSVCSLQHFREHRFANTRFSNIAIQNSS